MSELKPLFELEGRPVMRGQELHIAPSYHWRAGARAKVERFHNDEEVQLRSDNGAVPTVPVRALSWRAHPDTVAMEQMAEAGLGRASQRDLAVWKAARAQPVQAAPPAEQQIEAACEAVASALGDAYDCGRHWSAWSYGTMGPDDFSQVSEDDDRVREITLAALGAVGLKVTP